MKRRLLLPFLSLAFGLSGALGLAGCDQAEPAPSAGPSPGAGVTSDGATTASLEASVVLNGYDVTFLGVTAVPGGQQFSYRVTGLNPGPPAMDWFFLENACGADAVSLTPSNAVGSAVIDGVTGYKWNMGLGINETRVYAYTFAGAQLGVVQAKLSRGGASDTVHLPGPCGGLAVLSGSVFVNGDADPARNANEVGIPGVVVEVYDGAPGAGSPVATATTGAGGAFSFTLLESAFTDAGFYTVAVPEGAGGAFNATLYGSYDYVLGGAAQVQVVLDGDVSGKDLGFNPDRGQIIVDLSEGAYQTDARSIREWRRFILDAKRDRPCDPGNPDAVCRTSLLSHLRNILDDPNNADDAYYLLPNPFQGPAEADENALLSWALDRLSGNPRTDIERVSQKLLAMQLNNENGWGTGDPQYEDALQSYLEAWIDNGGGLRVPAAGLRPSGSGGLNELGPGSGGGTTEEEMADAYLRIGSGGGTTE